MPVLLLVAANSRTHDAHEVVDRAGAVPARGETAVPPDVSYHALPQSAPDGLARRLTAFLSGC
ncbi:hypothetical protein [Streptomyces durhamensis]|uniref:hypothetical protein n=1 Tax=Streptomyces durhamensis TaxID=68194 RepID=UPI000AAE8398